MKVIAVIEDPDELKRIPRHLIKIGRSTPGNDFRSPDFLMCTELLEVTPAAMDK
jgi:hypothetical protein